MNRIIVIVEMFFCLLVFLLSKPKVEPPAGLTPSEYQFKRSQCLSLPPGKISDCQDELDAQSH